MLLHLETQRVEIESENPLKAFRAFPYCTNTLFHKQVLHNHQKS
jgi:hypothetical protein